MKYLLISEGQKPRLVALLREAERRERGFHAFIPLDKLIENAAEINLPTLYTFADGKGQHYEICAWSEEDARKRLDREEWMTPPFDLVGQRTEWPGVGRPTYVQQEPDFNERTYQAEVEAVLEERTKLLKDIYSGLIELRETDISHCHHLLTVDMVDWIERAVPGVENEEDEAPPPKPDDDDVPF